MSTQAHTSGPWGVSRHATPESFPQFGVYAENGNGHDLAHVVSHGTARHAETEANARLIAAAPEMLAALETIAAGNTDPDRMVEIAAEALRKAEGEQ